jgi:arylsulfatase A-like enzyme
MHFLPQGGTINPWDNHGGSPFFGGLGGYAMLTQPYCLPSLDEAFAALLEDLAERGVLDETLVVLTGEFGRTPKINPANGRDHWGPCYTTVLAGGGIRGGQVYGASDRDAAFPKSSPVAPEDILATIYEALGISGATEVHDNFGRPFTLCTGQPVTALF